ncbi:c-type cytochrome [Reinekea forsetii]|nr:c-type cytochrome [Reinekea forsetii]
MDYNTLVKTSLKILIAGTFLVLSACTQDYGDAEGRSGGLNEKGQAIYAEQCASCHGSSGQGGNGGSLIGCATCGDTSSLIAKIERDMPSATKALKGDDARNTAEYVFDAFNSGSIGSVQRTLPGLATMTEKEAIYKIAFDLAGRLPTDEEVATFSENVGGEKEVIYGFMEEDYFYERLKDIFNEAMLTDRYRSENGGNVRGLYNGNNQLQLPNPNGGRYFPFPDTREWESEVPGMLTRNYLRFFAEQGLARKPMLYVEFLARNDRDFREFVSGKYTVVNKFMFDMLGDNVVIVDPDQPRPNGSSKPVSNPEWRTFTSQKEINEYLDIVEYLGGIGLSTTDRNQYIMSDYPYDPRDLKAAQIFYNEKTGTGLPRASGVPHSGVITDELFLNVYTATETNMHRNRARMIYWFFAAKDLLAIEGNRDASTIAFDDFDGVSVGTNDPTQENPDCKVCHDIMDPVAKAFESYALNGLWDPDNSDRVPAHLKTVGWGLSNADIDYNQLGQGTSYANRELQWLGEQIANDPAYARGIAQIVVSGMLGQQILGEPGDDSPEEYRNAYAEQSRLIANAATEFKADSYNIKALVYAVTKSAYYRSANVASPSFSDKYTQVGAVSYLAPQVLHQKLRALNSGGWTNSLDLRQLNSRQFIGGMNSNDILKDADSVGGIIAGVLDRMAVEEACDIVNNEFNRDREERALLKYVELNTNPMATNISAQTRMNNIRAIRSNIQFLYLAMLQKEVDLSSEEVNLVFDLFMSALENGATASSGCGGTNGNDIEDAWYVVVVFMLSDYRFIYG